MYPVAVLAGGLGLRLRELTGAILPKAMLPVLGRPFVDWKLEGLAASGVTEVVLLVGHSGDRIRDHVGSGKQFGLDVRYVEDGPTLRGTGGALLHALPLFSSCFWVTYGDTLLQFDVRAAESAFEHSGSRALMTVLHNRGELQPSNVVVDAGYVVQYGKSPTPLGAEHIDYGMLLFQQSAWACRTADEVFDLADVLAPLIAARGVVAFDVTSRFHDIGTPEAVRETEAFLLRHPPGAR
jgi:NDP-sugar pyrophosphorylase family protein